MKYIILIIITLIIFSCQSTKEVKTNKSENISTLWINSKKTMCNVGEIDKECFLVKRLGEKNWVPFSDEIKGFQYEEGYEYEIKIETKKIKFPPMDASNLEHTLVKMISKKKVKNGLSISNKWIISSLYDNGNIPLYISKKSFITINEKENRFKGNGACNNILGNVLISENNINFSEIISTKMACKNLEQENNFIKALKSVTTFKIIGCELFLYKDSKKLLVLESCRD